MLKFCYSSKNAESAVPLTVQENGIGVRVFSLQANFINARSRYWNELIASEQ